MDHWDLPKIQRFFGSEKSADRAAEKRNKKNKSTNILVFKFGPLYFVGTNQEYKDL